MRSQMVQSLFFAALPLCAQELTDPNEIMAKVAAKVEAASGVRRTYLYQQRLRGSLVNGGNTLRKEDREYSVFPQASKSEKKLASFHGEYRKNGKMIPYTEPWTEASGDNSDAELLNEVLDDLANDPNSRDGIPHRLFPFASKDLDMYTFHLKGQETVAGRKAYVIHFDPKKKDLCVHVGSKEKDEESCDDTPWTGDTWIDVEDLQPARVQTDLAAGIPWGVRVFLGTNIRQLGFSATYRRVEPGVWFPATYGTEFKLNALWFYRRTITMSMESSGFRKTTADSSITFSEQ